MNIRKHLTETTPRTREFRRNVRWDAQTFTRTVGLIVLMLMMAVSLTGVAALEQANDDPISLPDYIMECYDGKGFAEYPGGMSTLDSTLDAVELLMDDTDRNDWSVSLMFALDDIVVRYAGMQSVYRGGFVSEGNTDPDVMTTALVLETLKVLGCLDDEHIDMERVRAYVGSSSNGLTSDVGLEFNRWPYQGVFEWTYGLIRAAVALDDPRLVGLRSVSLAENVFSPDRNPADVVESIPIMKWGEQTFAASDRFGGGFINEDYERQLQIVECLDLLMEREVEGPTIMDLMFDASAFAEEVVSRYDQDTRRFRTSDGDLTLRATADAFDVLKRVGRLDVLFSGGMAAIDLVDSVRTVESEVESWQEECDEGHASLSERRSLAVVENVLDDAVDVEVVRFTPVFGESDLDTGVEAWESTSAPVAAIPEILWEQAPVPEAQEDMSTVFAYLPYAVIMLIGIIASLCGKKNIAFLSVLCLALFFFQQMYSDMVVTQTIELLSSLVPSMQRPFPDMTRWVTSWSDMTSKGPMIDQVFPQGDLAYDLDKVLRNGGRPGQFVLECRTWAREGVVQEVWVDTSWTDGSKVYKLDMQNCGASGGYTSWMLLLDVEWDGSSGMSNALEFTIHARDSHMIETMANYTAVFRDTGLLPRASALPAWKGFGSNFVRKAKDFLVCPLISKMRSLFNPSFKLEIETPNGNTVELDVLQFFQSKTYGGRTNELLNVMPDQLAFDGTQNRLVLSPEVLRAYGEVFGQGKPVETIAEASYILELMLTLAGNGFFGPVAKLIADGTGIVIKSYSLKPHFTSDKKASAELCLGILKGFGMDRSDVENAIAGADAETIVLKLLAPRVIEDVESLLGGGESVSGSKDRYDEIQEALTSTRKMKRSNFLELASDEIGGISKMAVLLGELVSMGVKPNQVYGKPLDGNGESIISKVREVHIAGFDVVPAEKAAALLKAFSLPTAREKLSYWQGTRTIGIEMVSRCVDRLQTDTGLSLDDMKKYAHMTDAEIMYAALANALKGAEMMQFEGDGGFFSVRNVHSGQVDTAPDVFGKIMDQIMLDMDLPIEQRARKRRFYQSASRVAAEHLARLKKAELLRYDEIVVLHTLKKHGEKHRSAIEVRGVSSSEAGVVINQGGDLLASGVSRTPVGWDLENVDDLPPVFVTRWACDPTNGDILGPKTDGVTTVVYLEADYLSILGKQVDSLPKDRKLLLEACDFLYEDEESHLVTLDNKRFVEAAMAYTKPTPTLVGLQLSNSVWEVGESEMLQDFEPQYLDPMTRFIEFVGTIEAIPRPGKATIVQNALGTVEWSFDIRPVWDEFVKMFIEGRSDETGEAGRTITMSPFKRKDYARGSVEYAGTHNQLRKQVWNDIYIALRSQGWS